MEARQRAEVVEAASEHLKEALAKAETNLAKVKSDLASKKEKREAEAMKAQEELVEANKRVEEKAMGKYNASIDFAMKKAGWWLSFIYQKSSMPTAMHSMRRLLKRAIN